MSDDEVAAASTGGLDQFSPTVTKTVVERVAPILRRWSAVWVSLVLLQFVLGACTIWTNKAADIATAHVATGALTTASASGITCTFPTASVNIAKGATTTPVPIMVSVGATASAAVAQRSGSIATAAFWAVPLFALLAWIGQRKSPRRNFFRFLGMLLLIIGLGHTIGCGGSFNRPTLPSSSIPAGNYLIQVSGTGSDNNTYYAVVPVSVN